MIKPNFPKNEDKRIAALKELNVLDTPSEERFDRLTRMAKNSFDVPISLVSLVDSQRQWFKSCVGLPVRETARDISFCGHAILGDEPFIIPDTHNDIRFADNPLVLNEPNIRFYAGIPLKAATGEMLGTLCIIDTKPRVLNATQIQALQDLAYLAEREIAITQITTFDHTTNLSNRRGFIALASQGLSLSHKHEIKAGLICLDINNFSSINEKYGDSVADKLLLGFADSLKKHAIEPNICARLKKDEFVTLLFDISSEKLDDYLSSITRSFNDKVKQTGLNVSVSFSYEVVMYQPEKHHIIDDLLNDGQRAMQEQKKSKIEKIRDQINYLSGKIAIGRD